MKDQTSTPLRIAVLASGRGSNLGALLAARDSGALEVDIVQVVSDKASAPALRLAQDHGIATLALNPRGYPDRRTFDMALFERLAESGAELLVLAGFMRIIHADALVPWHGRMINIHPSLLPHYRGLHTHRRALEAGDRVHGASVHFVTAELDGGPVIAQVTLDVEADDNEQTLAERLLPLEHQLLTAVVAAIADRLVALATNGRVAFDGEALRAPLRLINGALLK